MSQENVEIVKRSYDGMNDAYKTGDYLRPIEEVCHPNVVLRTSGMFPETGEYHGYAGLREFTTNQAEAFEQMSVRPVEFVDAGDQIVVPVRFGGKARHTGIETTFSVAHVWTIHDGKVSRLDMYRSREDALKAVGLEQAMSQENLEIVRSIYVAFAQRDGVTPFKHYAPDIEWENLHWQAVGVPAVYHRHDGVHAMFQDILEAFREFEFRTLELTPIGDHVLVTVDEHGVGRMSGVVVDRRHYAAWTLHNGMVTRVCVYLDHADALKAVGLAE